MTWIKIASCEIWSQIQFLFVTTIQHWSKLTMRETTWCEKIRCYVSHQFDSKPHRLRRRRQFNMVKLKCITITTNDSYICITSRGKWMATKVFEICAVKTIVRFTSNALFSLLWLFACESQTMCVRTKKKKERKKKQTLPLTHHFLCVWIFFDCSHSIC